jgi:SAM-dependent methyltransferase
MAKNNKRFGIDYDNTIEANRELWSVHTWSRDGDEWDGQARLAGVPYEEWKTALVDEFIVPNIRPGMTVLEIAAGHGRWSEIMLPLCEKLFLIDLNPECIEHCRTRFASATNVEYFVNDGKSLSGIADGSIDFVWSFDSFVHMDRSVIQQYFFEIKRVLRPAGRAAIHHAGRKHRWLWLGRIRHRAKFLRSLYARISMGVWDDDDGWRSNVSPEVVRELVENAGLVLVSQNRYWGKDGRYGVRRYGDIVSTLRQGE